MKTRKLNLPSSVTMALGATLLLAPHAMAAEGASTPYTAVETSKPNTTAKTSKLNAADARFIQDETVAGAALVKMADLAKKNAQKEEVKALAATLSTDHAKANAELATLAASKGVNVSPDRLEQAKGAEFDQQFLALVISGHENCVKNFTQASTDAQDSEVRAWAAKMLPGLQSHLDQARALSAEWTPKAGATSSTTSATKPDNTASNMRDRDLTPLTPLDQGNSKADTDRTAEIRRAILDREGLSVNARNVKVITNDGHVTLRGPVNSAEEKRQLGEIAARIATQEHTDNQLEVPGDSVN